jgi:hypothetical protein
VTALIPSIMDRTRLFYFPALFFPVLRVPIQRRRRMAMGSPAWSEREQKGAQPSLVRALELLPFSALSKEGKRSGRDKYDLDFGFGPGLLCKRLRNASPRRKRRG